MEATNFTAQNDQAQKVVQEMQEHAKALLKALGTFESMEYVQYREMSAEVDRLCDLNLRDLESICNALTTF
ncbi:MAG: hypothetical protein ACR2LR_08300 [Hassallia sp.]